MGEQKGRKVEVWEKLKEKGIVRDKEEYERLMEHTSIVSFRIPTLVATIIVNVTINYPKKETEELEKEEKKELSPEETVIQRLLTTFETWEQLQPEAKPYFEALRKPLYTNLDFREKLKRLLEVARKLRDNDMLNDKAYQYIQKTVFEALKQKR